MPGGKIIDEYVGRASVASEQVSVAHMHAPGGWEEPFQTPEFDEITVVIDGLVRVEHGDGVLDVTAGQAVLCRAGERIRYTTPSAEGARYVAVCLPAFSPETVHREEE